MLGLKLIHVSKRGPRWFKSGIKSDIFLLSSVSSSPFLTYRVHMIYTWSIKNWVDQALLVHRSWSMSTCDVIALGIYEIFEWSWHPTKLTNKEICFRFHYNDVIVSAMASQITSLTLVYSSVFSGTDQRKHQSSALLAFVGRIHRWPVNSPHKGPVTRKMFQFDDVIMRTHVHLCVSTNRAMGAAHLVSLGLNQVLDERVYWCFWLLNILLTCNTFISMRYCRCIRWIKSCSKVGQWHKLVTIFRMSIHTVMSILCFENTSYICIFFIIS